MSKLEYNLFDSVLTEDYNFPGVIVFIDTCSDGERLYTIAFISKKETKLRSIENFKQKTLPVHITEETINNILLDSGYLNSRLLIYIVWYALKNYKRSTLLALHKFNKVLKYTEWENRNNIWMVNDVINEKYK